MLIEEEGESKWEYTVALWCMSPAVAFRALEGCRSVIVMSGTLSPMDSFGQELATEFPIQLEAQHVTPPSSVCYGFVTTIICNHQ